MTAHGGRPDLFWERPEQVDRFAAREPDLRLLDLLADYERPERTRVLDLGCAAGRNTVLLAERGFDVRAVDRSRAMVERTRRRLAALVGDGEARRRVRTGRMEDLGGFPDAHFELVVALGVYHNADSVEQWERSLAETARVLAAGGRVLVGVFTPDTDLTGEGVRPVAGQPGVFEGFPAGPAFLVDVETLDAAMARHGLHPEVPSRVVVKPHDPGRRVTVNALYRKPGGRRAASGREAS